MLLRSLTHNPLASLNRCKRRSLANAKPSAHAMASIVSGSDMPFITDILIIPGVHLLYHGLVTAVNEANPTNGSAWLFLDHCQRSFVHLQIHNMPLHKTVRQHYWLHRDRRVFMDRFRLVCHITGLPTRLPPPNSAPHATMISQWQASCSWTFTQKLGKLSPLEEPHTFGHVKL